MAPAGWGSGYSTHPRAVDPTLSLDSRGQYWKLWLIVFLVTSKGCWQMHQVTAFSTPAVCVVPRALPVPQRGSSLLIGGAADGTAVYSAVILKLYQTYFFTSTPSVLSLLILPQKGLPFDFFEAAIKF